MIYFTELQNLPMYGVKGEFLGELEDICVDPSKKGARGILSGPHTPQGPSVHHLLADPIHLGARRPNQRVAGRNSLLCGG